MHCIRLVYSDCISYTYKSSDREALNQLYSQRGDADDILIVKKGLLTDTSIANIALYNGTEWYTPVSPLLKGTKRAFLIDQGIIREQNILIGNLDTYSKITLFNALIDFRTIELSVDQLHMR